MDVMIFLKMQFGMVDSIVMVTYNMQLWEDGIFYVLASIKMSYLHLQVKKEIDRGYFNLTNA